MRRALKKAEARLNRPRYGGKEKDMSDMKDKIVEFSCPSPGQNSCATCKVAGGMPADSIVSINGTTDLENIIQFNDDGKVYGIRLKGSPGYYDFVLEVDAEGPHGAFSGSGHLTFTDASKDTYHLGIYSSSHSDHTVRYNSDKPNITLIEWNS
jgi:hypothetical protein